MSTVRPAAIEARSERDSDETDPDAFQQRILAGVSRTFALTIPELPADLRRAVSNAYLLCRIADTIEDELALDAAAKAELHERFIHVTAGRGDARTFADTLAPQLAVSATRDELALVRNTDLVMRAHRELSVRQQRPIRDCVRVMSSGMPEFERRASPDGLRDLTELDRYCYYVAGVVGQMLTELFCAHSPQIQSRRNKLLRLSVSFGQALQMTNILKDMHEDRARGVCWLPRDMFEQAGFELRHLGRDPHDPAFAAGLAQLIGLAHGHLRNALEYTLTVPPDQTGIRRFCLWALGLAVLTLRKIQARPGFTRGEEVKVTRGAVQATVLATNLTVRDDARLRQLFHIMAGSLPTLSPALPAAVDGVRPPWSEVNGTRLGESMAQSPDVIALDTRETEQIGSRLERAVDDAAKALEAEQDPAGHWCYELEADCTIPAEYVLMMHFMDEIDPPLQAKLANYLRRQQDAHGGWSLYYGGDLDVSCSVKAYYALKLAGDDSEAPHMRHARKAILAHGGAARANVFTLIALAQFGQIPWRGVPFIPVEVMLLPRMSPFHLSKVSYWSRTVMVPLMILTSLKVTARNPSGVNVRELFTVPPEEEREFLPAWSLTNRLFKGLDIIGRNSEPLIPGWLRRRALRAAETWMRDRLNGEGGLGAIFPAMVNAYEALDTLGYPADDPRRVTARQAIDDLLVIGDDEAYCQPCNSPVWDTGLACHALQEARGANADAVRRGLDWLQDRQLLDAPGDWREDHPGLAGGGWPFQFKNDYYPDLDDTAVVAWAMHETGDESHYGESVRRAADWLAGMQSQNGGFAAFDSDNDHQYLNEIPFADHGALLDPPTSDVTARVATLLGRMHRSGDAAVLRRAIRFLRAEQERDGAWFGRWGTNYIYGTWSALTALAAAGEDMHRPYVRKAVTWLEGMQRADGGWGEDNGSYWDPPRGRVDSSTTFQTAWALLGLMAAGEAHSTAVRRGVEFLIARQESDGLWRDPEFTAPGFPRVFYLKYHGYTRYFPLWALARYRNLTR